MSLKEQKNYLDNFLMRWQDANDQVDDIVIMGIKL